MHPLSAHRLAVAPMTECTDRHCRYMLRLLAPDALLYTGMFDAAAILRGGHEALLGFDAGEHPLVLQLGGGDAAQLAAAAAVGEALGYDQFNLCADAIVPAAPDGARHMADCVAAVRARVQREVTVKVRIGHDAAPGAQGWSELDYAQLWRFVALVAQAGCRTFIIHVRKQVLGGVKLRDWQIPPLRHDVALRLKADFPQLAIIANGGIESVVQARALLARLDGVMIGRKAYHDPWSLVPMQQEFGLDARWRPPTQSLLLRKLAVYAARQVRAGCRLQAITRHFRGLFTHHPPAPLWQQFYLLLDTELQAVARSDPPWSSPRSAAAPDGMHCFPFAVPPPGR